MGLVPENTIELGEIGGNTQPSLTYYIDFENNSAEGECSGNTALMQAVYKILSTERYGYVIYDRGYGIELNDLIGKPYIYAAAVLKGRIEEALLWDERIEAIEDFSLNRKGDSLVAEFSVVSNGKKEKAVKTFEI